MTTYTFASILKSYQARLFGFIRALQTRNEMQRKCTIRTADSSRAECIRYVTRNALSQFAALETNRNEREKQNLPTGHGKRGAGCNPCTSAVVEAKIAWKARRTNVCVYKISCGNTFACNSLVHSVYLRQIPLDTILSLLYTFTRRHPPGIRDTASRRAAPLRAARHRLDAAFPACPENGS